MSQEWNNILTEMNTDNLLDARKARIAVNYFKKEIVPEMAADGVSPDRQARIKANFFNTLSVQAEKPSKMPTLSAYGIETDKPVQGAVKSNVVPGMDVPTMAKPMAPVSVPMPQDPADRLIQVGSQKADIQKSGKEIQLKGQKIGVIKGILEKTPTRTPQDIQQFNSSVIDYNKQLESYKTKIDDFNRSLTENPILPPRASKAGTLPAETKISTLPPESTASKIKGRVASVLGLSAPEPTHEENIQGKVRATNILSLSDAIKLPPSFVEQNYDAITQQLGLRGQPTFKEMLSGIMAAGIAAGLVTNPLATVLRLTAYMGIKETESLGVQYMKGERAKLGRGREISEYIERPSTAVEVAEVVVPAFISGFGLDPWFKSLAASKQQLVVKSLNTMVRDGMSNAEIKAAWRDPANREAILRRANAGSEPTRYAGTSERPIEPQGPTNATGLSPISLVPAPPTAPPPATVDPVRGIVQGMLVDTLQRRAVNMLESARTASTPQVSQPVEQAKLPDWVPPSIAVSTPRGVVKIKPEVQPSTPAPPEEEVSNPVPPLRDVDTFNPVYLNVNDLKLSEEVPNFKENADKRTGVVKGEQLQGKFDEIGTAPIIVWERLNGDKEIVSGRHRWDLAKRNGKETILAQVMRESDGFSAKDARIMDAEQNIKDEKGTVKDYARYFRETDIDKATARSRGLLSRSKQITPWILGKYASSELFSHFTAGNIKPEQGAAIALAARDDEGMQRAGIWYALKHKTATEDELTSFLEDLKNSNAKVPESQQMDMFGDDSSVRLAEARSRLVAKKISGFTRERGALSLGKKSQEMKEAARRAGIDVTNEAQVLARVEELNGLIDKWSKYSTNPELSKQLDNELNAGVGEDARSYKPEPGATSGVETPSEIIERYRQMDIKDPYRHPTKEQDMELLAAVKARKTELNAATSGGKQSWEMTVTPRESGSPWKIEVKDKKGNDIGYGLVSEMGDKQYLMNTVFINEPYRRQGVNGAIVDKAMAEINKYDGGKLFFDRREATESGRAFIENLNKNGLIGETKRISGSGYVEEYKGRPEVLAEHPDLAKPNLQTVSFSDMVSEAQRWQGAARNADIALGDNKRARLSHSNMTTKGDLDAYLMKKFGVDATTARDVSNELTRKNIKPDMTAKIEDFKGEPWADTILAKPAESAISVLNDLNPTNGIFVDYTPEARAKMPLGKNITTLDKTMGKSPDDTITIYRGATAGQKEIVAGDFITTNKQLAKDYAGTGTVLEKKVKLSDILDDNTEPLGGEYIYRPETTPKAVGGKVEQIPIDNIEWHHKLSHKPSADAITKYKSYRGETVNDPIIITEDNYIIDGAGRYSNSKFSGNKSIEVIRLPLDEGKLEDYANEYGISKSVLRAELAKVTYEDQGYIKRATDIAEENGDYFTDERARKILDLPNPSRPPKAVGKPAPVGEGAKVAPVVSEQKPLYGNRDRNLPITDNTPGSYAMYERKGEYESALDKDGNYDILEAKRKGYVTNQLELDLSNYGRDIETVSKPAISTVGRGLGAQSGGLRTIASKIPANLKNRGFISLVGTEVKNSRDLAAAAQIFRDPRVETLRIFYLKSKKIAGHEGISSRMPGFVSFAASTYVKKLPSGMFEVVMPKGKIQVFSSRQEATLLKNNKNEEELTKQISKIIARAMRLGADEINLLHNHPSENISASSQDIEYTAMMERRIKEIAGKMKIANPPKVGRHVVIDHKKYLVFGPDPFTQSPKVFDFPEGAPNAPKSMPHELLEFEITVPGAVAEIGKELQRPQGHGTLIYRSSNGNVTAIQDVSLGTLKGKGASAFLRGRAREFGAREVFLYVDDLNSIGTQTANALILNGSLKDVVHTKGKVLGGFVVDDNILFGEPAGKYKGMRVAEETAGYSGVPPTEEQRKEYAERQRNIIELPEIVEIAKDLMGGKYPKTRRFLGAALGRFYPGSGKIDVISNMTLPQLAKTLAHEIGHLNDWLQDKSMSKGNIFGRIASIPGYLKSLLEEYPDSPNKILTDEDRVRLREEARLRVEADSAVADRVIVTEVTREVPRYEVTGVTPDMILDIMRGITNEPDNILRFMQTASAEVKKSIVKQALRGMVDASVAALGGRRQVGVDTVTERVETVVPGRRRATVEATFRQMVRDEILRRKLYEKEVIMKELKALTHEWKPFDEALDPKMTKYRLSSKELYADAVSVLMNDPEMLSRVAPMFKKAFFNYLERKPDFKVDYDDIQERLLDPETVLAKRDEFQRGMAVEGAKVRAGKADYWRARFSLSKLGHEIARYFAEKNIKSFEKVKEMQKQGKEIPDHMRIDYWTEELPYINSEVSAFVRDIEKNIISKAKEKGITVIDLHVYMLNKRAATERKGIYNPGGIGDTYADRQLEFMRKKLGDEKFDNIEKFVSDFRIKFAKHVLDVVDKADFLPRVLMNSMLNNPNYATFANLEYEINKKFGSGSGARIYRQYGMLGEVDNVFIQTVLKGQALIRAARHHETKMALLTLLAKEGADGEIIKAKRGRKGVGWEHPPDDTYGTIIVSPGGRPQAYHVDREFADMWENKPDKAHTLMNLGMMHKAILAKLYIAWNVGWLAANPLRDMMGTWKKVHDASGFIARGYATTLGDAFRAGFGKLPERELRLLRQRVIVPERFWMEETGWDAQEREFLSFVQDPIRYKKGVMGEAVKLYDYIKKNNLDRYLIIPPMARFVNNVGQSLERWGKFGPEEALRLKEKAERTDLGEKYIGHTVRTMAGTPNSLARGLATKITEAFFPFSNIAIQDIRSSYESGKQKPWSYAFRTLVANILPKILFAAMVAGWFDWMSEDIKKVAKKAGKYIRRSYNILPVGEVNGDGLFLTFPQDYSGQMIGSLADSIITGELWGTMGTLGQVMEGQPYNLSPFLSSAADWISYYGYEIVPRNYFYGTDIMTKNQAEAGGKEALSALSKETWNTFFGGMIYRFRSDTVTEANDELKKLISTPPVGRFLRLTDAGIKEADREIIKEQRKKEAVSAIQIKRDKIEAINKLKDKPTIQDAYVLYRTLVDKKQIDPIKTPFTTFANSFVSMGTRKEGNAHINSFISATTTGQKVALLDAWKKELTAREYSNLYNMLQNIGEIGEAVMVEQEMKKTRGK
jgi:hypothetical protein